jgi:hypothetical protein
MIIILQIRRAEIQILTGEQHFKHEIVRFYAETNLNNHRLHVFVVTIHLR